MSAWVECRECGGAGFFGNGPIAEACFACHGEGGCECKTDDDDAIALRLEAEKDVLDLIDVRRLAGAEVGAAVEERILERHFAELFDEGYRITAKLAALDRAHDQEAA
jgi:hypothetical protein